MIISCKIVYQFIINEIDVFIDLFLMNLNFYVQLNLWVFTFQCIIDCIFNIAYRYNHGKEIRDLCVYCILYMRDESSKEVTNTIIHWKM